MFPVQVRSPRSTRNARRFRFLRSSDLHSRPWCPVTSASVRDKQWARFEQYCVRKASQAGRSSRVREAWHRRRQSRKGVTARGPRDPHPHDGQAPRLARRMTWLRNI